MEPKSFREAGNVQNIYECEELEKDATSSILELVRKEGKRNVLIDDVVYVFGASLKDAGKKLFAYIRIILLFPYLNIYFRFELSHIDKICDGKQHVLKKIMKLADEVQVLCQLRIKPLIPIRRRTVHSNE